MESVAPFRQGAGAECYFLQAARSQQNGTLREVWAKETSKTITTVTHFLQQGFTPNSTTLFRDCFSFKPPQSVMGSWHRRLRHQLYARNLVSTFVMYHNMKRRRLVIRGKKMLNLHHALHQCTRPLTKPQSIHEVRVLIIESSLTI